VDSHGYTIGYFPTDAAQTDYIFTRNTVTNKHAIIELALDLSIFGGADLEEFYWLPSCGNDELHVSTDISTVPAPATLALMGLGLLGIRSHPPPRRQLKNIRPP
jgi:hypothetical protein